MGIFGSSNIVSAFLQKGMIDELRLFVIPVLLGGGKPFFSNLRDRRASGLKFCLYLSQNQFITAGLRRNIQILHKIYV